MKGKLPTIIRKDLKNSFRHKNPQSSALLRPGKTREGQVLKGGTQREAEQELLSPTEQRLLTSEAAEEPLLHVKGSSVLSFSFY